MKPMKMNTPKLLLLLSSVLSSALFPLDAKANIEFSVTPVYDPIAFGPAGGGYGWAGLTLPVNTQIGSTAQYLQLNLTQPITVTDAGAGYNYGFGMSGLDPTIAYQGEAFTFQIQLLYNGTLLNTTPFGFTEVNPFDPVNFPGISPVDNLYVTTSTTALNSTLTFDRILIAVSNNSQDETVRSFGVSLGVNNPAPVPEPSTYIAGALALLPFGASALRILRKKTHTA